MIFVPGFYMIPRGHHRLDTCNMKSNLELAVKNSNLYAYIEF